MNTMVKIKIILFTIISFLLVPIFAKAANCCEVSITSGMQFAMTSYSCEDGETVNKDSCKNDYGIGYSKQVKFQEGASCNSEKKCISSASADDLKKDLSKTSLKPINFTFNVPLPGLEKSFVIDGNSIPKYVIWLYKFVFGVACLLAVFMITLGGLMWIFSGGNAGNVKKAKEYITGSIAGLLFAVFSYSILFIINPQLILNQFPEINTVRKVELAVMSSADYQLASGVVKKSTPEIIAMAKKMAKDYKMDYCAAYTILITESSGDPGAIGFDEDAPSAAIGSRNVFVSKGCKQTHSGKSNGSCSATGSSINDDRCLITSNIPGACTNGKDFYTEKFKNCKRQDLCLDWRYTRGFGLFQASVWEPCTVGGENTVCVKAGDKFFTPRQFLKPENQFTWFQSSWSSYYCPSGSDMHSCWVRYSGSENQYVATKDATYKDCKKNNP